MADQARYQVGDPVGAIRMRNAAGELIDYAHQSLAGRALAGGRKGLEAVGDRCVPNVRAGHGAGLRPGGAPRLGVGIWRPAENRRISGATCNGFPWNWRQSKRSAP